jgi:hypothetical protein
VRAPLLDHIPAAEACGRTEASGRTEARRVAEDMMPTFRLQDDPDVEYDDDDDDEDDDLYDDDENDGDEEDADDDEPETWQVSP